MFSLFGRNISARVPINKNVSILGYYQALIKHNPYSYDAVYYNYHHVFPLLRIEREIISKIQNDTTMDFDYESVCNKYEMHRVKRL